MALRVDIEPKTLIWAIERSRRPMSDLVKRQPKLPAWLSGELSPTLKQLESLAAATYTPLGFLLLPEPVEEELPVPDFRTMGDAAIKGPSANLLETLALCSERQEWYRSYAQETEQPKLAFVGSLLVEVPPTAAARAIEEVLDFSISSRVAYGSWSDALRGLIEQAENAGILVMVSGVVASNTHRILDPREFRGFAFSDELAPVIFINGADTKAAQIFSLAHELAHVWLGESAVSNAAPDQPAFNETERWCNDVAAELLVPQTSFLENYDQEQQMSEQLETLARLYRVSTLVILRRVFDVGLLEWADFRAAYQDELERVLGVVRADGGNFFNTQPVRASKRFTRAILTDTLEGRTLYRDAFRLIGFKKLSTFEGLSERLGVS